MKRITKVIAAAVITLGALAADPAEAHADPGKCSVYYPYAPSSDSICVGGSDSGVSCSLQLYGCSPVPGKPGTWNPRGYTPCLGEYNGCYR
jgi:hypothetical protein